jgi:hypothetical protein
MQNRKEIVCKINTPRLCSVGTRLATLAYCGTTAACLCLRASSSMRNVPVDHKCFYREPLTCTVTVFCYTWNRLRCFHSTRTTRMWLLERREAKAGHRATCDVTANATLVPRGPACVAGCRSGARILIQAKGDMLYRVMSCHVILFYVVLCHVMLCRVMICWVVLCHVMSCYFMLCYVISCYVMSCHVMGCYVMLWYVVSCSVMSCRHVMVSNGMLCHVVSFMSCYGMLCYNVLCHVMLCKCANMLIIVIPSCIKLSRGSFFAEAVTEIKN